MILSAASRAKGLSLAGMRCQGARRAEVFSIMSSIAVPAAAVAEILVGELPALERVGEPVAEPHLLVGRDVEDELHQLDPLGDEHALELVDLLEGAAPSAAAAKPSARSTSTRPYQERSKATISPCVPR